MRDQHAQPELANIQKPHIILQSSGGQICFGLGPLFTGFFGDVQQHPTLTVIVLFDSRKCCYVIPKPITQAIKMLNSTDPI